MVDIFGGRKVITEALPILSAFLPSIGFGILCGAFVGGCIGIRNLDAALCAPIIEELDRIVDSGDAFFAGIRTRQLPRKDAGTFHVLPEKYLKWIANIENGSSSWDDRSLNRAAQFSEILRAYGYFRGRWKIRQERLREKA